MSVDLQRLGIVPRLTTNPQPVPSDVEKVFEAVASYINEKIEAHPRYREAFNSAVKGDATEFNAIIHDVMMEP